jgi:hypothetical protein
MVIGEPVGGKHFGWELFASFLASDARRERSLPKARLAVMVYDTLAKRVNPEEEYRLRLSEMHLRAGLIGEFGARTGDSVLDPEIIVRWFWSVATLPFDEAARLSSEFRDHPNEFPIETLRKLLHIKYSLTVLRHIRERGRLEGYPELEKWIELWDKMP